MSGTYKTEKESIIAERRIGRNRVGEPILPSVKYKKPRTGDIHPIPKSVINGLLKSIPIEYYYGLKGIELRPRQNENIGCPFGLYNISEKTIYLYSLPLIWEFPIHRFEKCKKYGDAGAVVEREENIVKVKWEPEIMLGIWFITDVFFHELGHHYVHQYRHKNKRPCSRVYNELKAEINAAKIRKLFFKYISNKSG